MLYKPWKPKGFFLFEIIINVSFSSFRFMWILFLWVYTAIIIFLILQASESDVCIRQILTYTCRRSLRWKGRTRPQCSVSYFLTQYKFDRCINTVKELSFIFKILQSNDNCFKYNAQKYVSRVHLVFCYFFNMYLNVSCSAQPKVVSAYL